jgi:hypothetical protein
MWAALSFMRTVLSLSFSPVSTIFGFDAMPLQAWWQGMVPNRRVL